MIKIAIVFFLGEQHYAEGNPKYIAAIVCSDEHIEFYYINYETVHVQWFHSSQGMI